MDIKDFKDILVTNIKSLADKFIKKKPKQSQSDVTEGVATATAPPAKPVSGKKLKILVYAAMTVIFFVIGGVLSYNFYFFSEKSAPSQELTLSRPVPLSPSTNPNAPVSATSGATDSGNNTNTGQNAQENKQTQDGAGSEPPHDGKLAVQDSGPTVQAESKGVQSPVKKTARQVSEHDPFKSEFEKKYQTAVKKEKGDSLSDLEGSIKEAKLSPMPPITPPPPPPPPPPPAKALKLVVFGTVLSPTDTYAITDVGVIRIGNTVESFIVESIKNDVVVLRQIDNKDEVRNIFVRARRQADGMGGVPPHIGGQQWQSNQ